MKIVHSSIISAVLLGASLLRTGACQTKGTLEIPFDVQQDAEHGVSSYAFNISLGTPPQVVSVGFNTDSSEVKIGKRGFVFNATTGKLADNFGKGYNADYSKSAKSNTNSVVLTRPFNWNNDSWPEGYADYTNTTYDYTSDNFTLGKFTLPAPLHFISGMYWSYSDPSQNLSPADSDNIFWNVLGLGFSSASAINYQALQSDPNAVMRGSVLDALHSAGQVKTRSYSYWLDGPEKKTGHLLLGGTDTSAYTAPLRNLNSTVRRTLKVFYEQDELTVKTELNDGQSPSKWNVQIGDASLTTYPGIYLPPTSIIQVWDRLGVDYKSLTTTGKWLGYNSKDFEPSELTSILPLVPCSYRTNQSTIAFSFSGTDITVKLSMAELTWGSYRYWTSTEGLNDTCVFAINAGILDQPAIIGAPIMKSLYVVHDLDNKAISVAYTKDSVDGKNVVGTPQNGGGVPPSSNLSDSAGDSPKKSFANTSFEGGSLSVVYLFAVLAIATALL